MIKQFIMTGVGAVQAVHLMVAREPKRNRKRMGS
jgi:hypothetical protein